MLEELFLSAQWRSRKESLHQCAARAWPFFRELGNFDSAFGQWAHGGHSRQDTLSRKFLPNPEKFRDLLAKGRNHYDTDRRVIEELGYSFSLWNCLDEPESIHLRVGCGMYPPPHVPFPNRCDIELSSVQNYEENKLMRAGTLLKLMEVIVRHWDPDCGCVSTFQMDETALPERHEYTGLRPGWLNYISDKWGPVPPLGEPYEVTRIDGFGSLVVIEGIDMITVSNPEHVRMVRDLWERMREAGLVLRHSGKRWIELPPYGTPVR